MTEDATKNLPADVPPATDTPPAQEELASPPMPGRTPPQQSVENIPISFAGRAGTGAIHVDTSTEHATPDTPSPSAVPQSDSASLSTDDIPITLAPLNPQPASTAPVPSDTPPAIPVKAGPAENSFRALGFLALLSLAILLAVQQATSIYLPSLFTPSEIATASLYEKMLAAGQWLVPPHTDALPAALPVYFWFVRLVDAIPSVDANYIYPLVSALSAFVALAGVYTLGLAIGFGNRVAFAAGLLLLASTGFTTLAHFLSPHLFFTGLLAFSMACLYRGWVSRLSYIWMAAGFILAGLSTLTGGLMGLIIPLLTSLIFVIWRGSFRRAHQLDAVFGFALLLIILLGWLGAIILLTGESTYLYTLTRQLFAPFLIPLWPPQDPWWLYLVRLPAALMPWVLVVLFVPWGRVCATAWPKVKASRSEGVNESSGAAWLWIALGIGILYLTVTSSKPCLAFVPLLPIAALLLAKALLTLPQHHSRAFFLMLALVFAVVALTLGALSVPFALSALTPYLPAFPLTALQHMQGLPLMAGVSAFAALVLWKFTRRALPAGALIVTVLLVTMLIQPAVLLVSPSLQGVAGETLQRGSAPAVPAAPAPVAPELPATQEAPATPVSPDSITAPPPAPPAPEIPAQVQPEAAIEPKAAAKPETAPEESLKLAPPASVKM